MAVAGQVVYPTGYHDIFSVTEAVLMFLEVAQLIEGALHNLDMRREEVWGEA